MNIIRKTWSHHSHQKQVGIKGVSTAVKPYWLFWLDHSPGHYQIFGCGLWSPYTYIPTIKSTANTCRVKLNAGVHSQPMHHQCWNLHEVSLCIKQFIKIALTLKVKLDKFWLEDISTLHTLNLHHLHCQNLMSTTLIKNNVLPLLLTSFVLISNLSKCHMLPTWHCGTWHTIFPQLLGCRIKLLKHRY